MMHYRGRGHWIERAPGDWRAQFTPPLDIPPHATGQILLPIPPPAGDYEFAIEIDFVPIERSEWRDEHEPVVDIDPDVRTRQRKEER